MPEDVWYLCLSKDRTQIQKEEEASFAGKAVSTTHLKNWNTGCTASYNNPMPRSRKSTDMAMQHAWIPGTRKTTRPWTTLQSNHPPLHAPSATYSNHITGNMHCIHILQPEMVRVATTMTNRNLQSSSFKMNTLIPSHSKTLKIHQCILQQYEPKSTIDSGTTF